MTLDFPKVIKSFKSRWPLLAICTVITALAVVALLRHYQMRYHLGSKSDLVGRFENSLLDLRFKMRGPLKESGKVGILAIDEKSLQRFGRWPFSRKYYEQAFNNLKKLGVNWVAFDVVWNQDELSLLSDVYPHINKLKHLSGSNWHNKLQSEIQAISGLSNTSLADKSLARAFTNFENIILGYFNYGSKYEANALGKEPFKGLEQMLDSAVQAVVLPDGKELKDYPKITAHGTVANSSYISSHVSHFAFFNNAPDDDAINRWLSLVANVDNHLMPSMTLKLAAQATGREPVVFFNDKGITEVILMNPEDDQDLIKIPVDLNGEGRMLINHLGGRERIPHFSLVDAYDNRFTEKQRRELKGRNLILGPTAVGINDQRANPFAPDMDGVEIHATAVDNILSQRFMHRSSTVFNKEIAIIILIGLIFTPLMIMSKAAFSALSAGIFLTGFYWFDRVFWFGKGEWFYIGMPFIQMTALFISTTFYKYVTEEREKKKVKGAFSHYLSPDVINQVLDDPSALKLGGDRRELTVFFSDVRDFTNISESLTPEQLCELMNDYFTPMTNIILRNKGVLDKYIGDAVMAFWGAPMNLPEHADAAAVSALQMLFALDQINQEMPQKNFPTINIGIGLNTGPMSVGNMGSQERFCYTVMGDSVNLASRLESLTKSYGVKIMISDNTRRQLTRSDLFLRDLDDIQVKGKTEPVKVFELMRPDLLRAEREMKDLIGEFELGRQNYRQQHWTQARKHFTKCLQLHPKDAPTALYLRRISEKELQPSIDNWDGVYVFNSKTG